MKNLKTFEQFVNEGYKDDDRSNKMAAKDLKLMMPQVLDPQEFGEEIEKRNDITPLSEYVNFGKDETWEEYFPKSAYEHYKQVKLDIGNQGVHHKDLEKLRSTALVAITKMLKEIEKRYKLG